MSPSTGPILGTATSGPVVALRQQLIGYLGNANKQAPYRDIEAVIDAELARVRVAHPEFDSLADSILTLCLFIVPLFSFGTVAQYLDALLAAAKHADFLVERGRVAQAIREHLVEEPEKDTIQ